jgi:SHS2 domain-containing protein
MRAGATTWHRCSNALIAIPMTIEPRHVFEEHTGEVRVRLEAPSLPELFEEAGRALRDVVAPASFNAAALAEEEDVVVRASDRDALLVEWLNELVFRSETTKRIYPELSVERVSDRELRAHIRGVEVDDLRTAVKAATLHGVHIEERTAGGYTATVVLDV